MQYNLKEIAMYDFESTYKQYEIFLEQVKQAGEFWVNSYLSSIKELFNKSKCMNF